MADPSPIPGPRPVRSTIDPYERRQLHPLIDATVRVLPDPDVGMTEGALQLWLAALEANLRLVYLLDKPERPPVTVTVVDAHPPASDHPQGYPQPVDDTDVSPPPEPAEGLPVGDVDHGPPAAPAAALELDDDPPPVLTPEQVDASGRRHFTADQRRAAVAWTRRQMAPPGATVVEAAARLGVHISIMRRWLADPRYQPAGVDVVMPIAGAGDPDADPANLAVVDLGVNDGGNAIRRPAALTVVSDTILSPNFGDHPVSYPGPRDPAAMPPASPGDLAAVPNGDGTIRYDTAADLEGLDDVVAAHIEDARQQAAALEAELAGQPDPDPDPDDLAAEAAQPASLPPGDPFPSSRIRVDESDLADDARICRGCERNYGARHRLSCTQLDRTAERRAARRLDESRANLPPTPTAPARPSPSGMPFEKRPFDPDQVRARAAVGVDPSGETSPR